MEIRGLYQCRQCGTRFNVKNKIGSLTKDEAEYMFSAVDSFGHINQYDDTQNIVIHRCDDSTIEMAELIGWRRVNELHENSPV